MLGPICGGILAGVVSWVHQVQVIAWAEESDPEEQKALLGETVEKKEE